LILEGKVIAIYDRELVIDVKNLTTAGQKIEDVPHALMKDGVKLCSSCVVTNMLRQPARRMGRDLQETK
jgi:hypothetical protein